MKISYVRDKQLDLKEDIARIRFNTPASLLYFGHDENNIYFFDAGVEEQMEKEFMEQGALK